MPSVTCLRLSDAGVICHVSYLFQFSLLLFSILLARPHQHCSVLGLLVLIRNIGTLNVAENSGRYLSCAESTVQGDYIDANFNNYSVILTVLLFY